jgi:tetratricopeptide (TPR) repeat protein
MQTESVTYVAQRAESLVGLFYFLTLYGFLRGATGTRPMAWYAATVVFCLLGMGSKEVMVSAPLMVLLYDRAFVAGSFREAIRRRYGLYLAIASTWVLLAGLVLASNNRGGSAGLGSGVNAWTYLCTQFGAIAHYLRLAVWPHPLVFDYGFYLAKTPGEIVPYAIFIGLLGLGVVVALWRWPKIGFLGVWFFAILAPTSSFVPVKTQTIAEHRMYLPLAAVSACIVFGGCLLGRRLMEKGVFSSKQASTWSLWGVMLVGLVFSGMVFHRNVDYRNEDAIWTDTVKKAQNNARAHNNYAMILVRNHCIDQGIQEYNVAAKIKPDFLDPHYNLGLLFGDLGRKAESVAEYQKAIDIDPEHVGSLSSLGVLYASIGRVDDAIALYQRALKAKPDRPEVHYNYANALVMKKEYPQAIAEYREAFRCKPTFADAYCDLALLLATCSDASVRNGTEAVALAKQAVALSEGKDPSILETLAAAYAEAGQFNQALQTAHTALNMAVQQQNAALVQTIRTRAKLYEAGLPYHESEADSNAVKQTPPTPTPTTPDKK